MTAPLPADLAGRTLATLIALAAWASYGPLGSKYAAMAACALCVGWMLWQHPLPSSLRRQPTWWPALALLTWLALSAAWSPAPWRTIGSHLWQYGMLLLVPLLAAGCPPQAARRALQHFVVASAAVGTVFVLGHLNALPPVPMVWHTTLDAEGNQRIAASVLLALGAGLGAWLALNTSDTARWAWAGAAAVCVLALTLQDRRTGMLLLPTLLLVWGLLRQPVWWRRLLIAMLVLGAGATTWQVSDGVRARFAEGLAELRHYPGDDSVATSWGQRLRMWERTGDLVAERPWAGHGIGSWRGLWRQRVTPGTALAEHSTPHNEYLLLAQQGGAVAVGLWLWLLVAGFRQAAGAAAAGIPALMAWTALAWVGLFNAVLRDAKFALPLLLLAALGSAGLATARIRTAGPEVTPPGQRAS